jgi:thymidylate synthase
MKHEEEQYLELLNLVLNKGKKRKDRTGVGTISLFSPPDQIYDLSNGDFPLFTTKKMYFNGVKAETLWYLKGDDNIKFLKDNKCNIWNDWADKDGNLGPLYPVQFCDVHEYDRKKQSITGKTINQVKNCINLIKNFPNSRRILINLYNVQEINFMALHPCHYAYNFYVDEDYLNLKVIIRSNDLALGHPFNVAFASLFLSMICQCTDKKPGKLVIDICDAHIYLNHIDKVKEQIKRKPFNFPKLSLNKNIKDIFEFKMDDISIFDYKHHDTIKFDIAV